MTHKIIAYNLTISSLEMDNLTVPDHNLPPTGSGGVELTLWNTINEIQEDPQLKDYVLSGSVLLDLGHGLLNFSSSLNVLNHTYTYIEEAIDDHFIDYSNPHQTNFSTLGTASLSELNSLLTDATLDSTGSSRPPSGPASGDLTGSYPNPAVVRLTIDGTSLGLSSVTDQQILVRSGSFIIGTSSAPAGAVDHGLTSGLLDDDHPQYFRTDGTRALEGNLNMSGNNVTNVNLVDGRDVSVDGATLDSHVSDFDNPHSTSIGNLLSGTLAQLNSIIIDATLIDTNDSRLSDDRDPNLHGLGDPTRHSGSTLAELNSLITDATLDDINDSRTPTGSAGGDLTGSYPNPQVNTSIIDISTFSGSITAGQHGDLPGGTLHELATTSSAGFMSFLDKINLNYLNLNFPIVSGTLDDHVTNFNNPHSTSVGNLVSGTLAQLNSIISDATLDDVSNSRTPTGSAGGDLTGSYPNPQVIALTSNSIQYLLGTFNDGEYLAVSGTTIISKGISLAATASGQKSFGELNETNIGGTLSSIEVPASGTWVKWVSGSVGHSTDPVFVSSSEANNDFTIGISGSGTYFIGYTIGLDGPSGAAVRAAAFKNGTKLTHLETISEIITANAFFQIGTHGLEPFEIGDVIDLRVTSDGPDTFDIAAITFHIFRIGERGEKGEQGEPGPSGSLPVHGLGDPAIHTGSTLAELNFLITDATLDDINDSRTPTGSAGGDLTGSYPNPQINASIIDISTFSGSITAGQHGDLPGGTLHELATTSSAGFMSPEDKSDLIYISSSFDAVSSSLEDHIFDTNNPHSTSVGNLLSGTLAQLNSIIIDATLIDTNDSRLSDDRDPNLHGLGDPTRHSGSTLAELNFLISDATLDDINDSRTPTGSAGGDLTGSYPNPQVIAITSNGTSLTIGNIFDGQVLSRSGSFIVGTGSAGGGESNTASNIGTGEGVFANKVGLDLQFRSILGAGSVTILSGTNEITVSGSDNIAGPPTGPAGGDLTGSYPNPQVNASIIDISTFSGSITAGQHGDLPGGTLHELVTTSSAGFMSPEDKEKLEALEDAGSVQYATVFSSSSISTSSPAYVNAFGTDFVIPPTTGSYFAIFEGEYTGTSGNTVLEVAISLNQTASALLESERDIQPSGAGTKNTFITTVVLPGLTTADEVYALFRKAAGSGDAVLNSRRLSILKVVA